jgi:hypothetical protein
VLEVTVDQRVSRTASRTSDRYRVRRRPLRQEPYAAAGVEPGIEDILNDPVTWALMRRDGVSEGSLRRLISEMRQTLRARETAA